MTHSRSENMVLKESYSKVALHEIHTNDSLTLRKHGSEGAWLQDSFAWDSYKWERKFAMKEELHPLIYLLLDTLISASLKYKHYNIVRYKWETLIDSRNNTDKV